MITFCTDTVRVTYSVMSGESSSNETSTVEVGSFVCGGGDVTPVASARIFCIHVLFKYDWV